MASEADIDCQRSAPTGALMGEVRYGQLDSARLAGQRLRALSTMLHDDRYLKKVYFPHKFAA